MAEKQSSNKKLALVLSFAVSGVIILYLFYSLKSEGFIDRFLAELSNVNLAYIPALVVLFLISYVIRVLRWKLLLPTEGRESFLKLSEALSVGFLATFVLPARAGEFIRPAFLMRIGKTSFSAGFASVVTERVFDLVAILSLLGILLLRIESAPPLVVVAGTALGILTLVIIGIMLAAYVSGDKIERFSNKILQLLFSKYKPSLAEKLAGMIGEFIQGLKAISSLTELFLVIFWSYLLWIEFVFFYVVGMWAFGLTPELWVGLAVLVMTALAVAAPSAPGFIGTYQLGCVIALSEIYSYPKEFALGYSLFLHILQGILAIALGLIALKVENFGLIEVQESAENASLQ